MVRWCVILFGLMFLSVECKAGLTSPMEQLKAAFQATLIEKNFSAIPDYYDKDMRLYTNGKEMDYQTYLKSHQGMYGSDISYKIEYDPNAIVEEGNKVAARLWLTQLPSKTIEVVLIAEFKNGKIYRLWELTYPDWQQSLK